MVGFRPGRAVGTLVLAMLLLLEMHLNAEVVEHGHAAELQLGQQVQDVTYHRQQQEVGQRNFGKELAAEEGREVEGNAGFQQADVGLDTGVLEQPSPEHRAVAGSQAGQWGGEAEAAGGAKEEGGVGGEITKGQRVEDPVVVAHASSAKEAQLERFGSTAPEVSGFSAEDELRLKEVAASAMEDVRTAKAVHGRVEKLNFLNDWEIEMQQQVDDYLRNVAKLGAAPENLDELSLPPRDAAAVAADRRPVAAAAAAALSAASEGGGAAGDNMGEDLMERFEALQKILFLNKTSRDAPAALAGLRELSEVLEAAVPSAPSLRRKLAILPEGVRPPPLSETIRKARSQAMARHSKAIAWGGTSDKSLLKLAAPGDASFIVAAIMAAGIGAPTVELNDTKAVSLLHKSAMTGTLEAHMSLADRYFMGRGVPKNCLWGLNHAKAVADHAIQMTEETSNYVAPLPTVRLRDRWLDPNYVDVHEMENGAAQVEMEEDMARRGSVEAQRHLGFRRLLGQGMDANPDHAFREFQGAAMEGDIFAMFNLGYMYLRGVGTPQNFGEAGRWFNQAAQAGLPAASNGLGVMAFNGHGMAQNLTAARLAFEAGAAGGDADSMYNLGTMYRSGFGTLANQTLARKHFQDAYDAGHWRAGHSLALLAETGVDSDPPNCTLAESFMREFIRERFNWVPLLNEAQRAYDSGDDWAAITQLALLAEQGCEQAEANLAHILQRGSGYLGSDRHRLAMRMLLRSGQRGGSDSLIEAGHLALEGQRFQLPRGADPELAVKLYRRSADAGEPEAMFILGWLYSRGVGVPLNRTAAAEYYQMSIDRMPADDPALAATLALLMLRAEELCQGLLSLFSWLPFQFPAGTGNPHSSPTTRATPGWILVDTEWDTVLLALLLAALATVLWVRRRRINSHLQARQLRRVQQRQATPASRGLANSPPSAPGSVAAAATEPPAVADFAPWAAGPPSPLPPADSPTERNGQLSEREAEAVTEAEASLAGVGAESACTAATVEGSETSASDQGPAPSFGASPVAGGR
mmetsp:Transcript_11317/g.32104  ORF Transcript_11317/g.32104 Transcript_11317/m.32104 type:complete len:1034 (-) Transcript_11317:325-3426(-)